MSGWVKRVVVFAVFALVCVYAVSALRGPQGMSALFEKRREIQALQEQNATLAREIQMKKERIERLKHNTAEQELEIRRQLKLLRPGETSFILPESPKPETPRQRQP
jgi:cell division protein FtsB